MIDAYDKVVKLHIEKFLKVGKRKISVIGLQNEEDNQEDLFSQLGDTSDRIILPAVSVFRKPEIDITDDAGTKRVSNYSGYLIYNGLTKNVSLNVMRCDLHYGVEVFGENKKVTEDLACQLFFRLRNNPNPVVKIQLPVKDDDGNYLEAECIPNIVMSDTMRHLKTQSKETEQLYRLRIDFTLQNVNIYDFSLEEFYSIEYSVVAKLTGAKVILNSTESEITPIE